MAGTNAYNRAKEMLQEYNGQILHVNELRRLVAINLSSDVDRITKYVKMMTITGLLIEREHLKFQVIVD